MGILARLIRAWRTSEPQELASQLLQFQGDVDTALVRLDRGKWPQLRERAVSAGRHVVRLGELLVAESTSGDVVVTLPEITADTLGHVVGVQKLTAPNSLQLSAPRGRFSGAIDGVEDRPRQLAAPTVRLYVATTRGWTSVGHVPRYTFEAEITGSATIGNPLTFGSPTINDGFVRLSSNTLVRVPFPARWSVSLFSGPTNTNSGNAAITGYAMQVGGSTVAQFLDTRTSSTTTHRVNVSGQKIVEIEDPSTETIGLLAAGSAGTIEPGGAPAMNWFTVSYWGEL